MFNMKKEWFMFGAVLLVLLSVANMSAGVYFSQPESIYNIGDKITMEIDVSPLEEGFLRVDLICAPNSINIFKGIPNPDGKVSISVPLNFAYIEDMNGKCNFLAYYKGEGYEGREFKISDLLDVKLDLDNLVIKPGENFTIAGTAKRLNDMGIDGDVKITIPLLSFNTGIEESEPEETEEDNETSDETSDEISDEENNETEEDTTEEVEEVLSNDVNGVFTGVIIDGVFSVDIRLGEKIPAGQYRVDVLAYEDISGERRSEGLEMADLKVLQILSEIDVAIINQNINPGETFEFKPILLDQTGIEISDEVSAIIIDDKSKVSIDELVTSNNNWLTNYMSK